LVEEKSIQHETKPKNFKEWDFLVKKQETVIASLKFQISKISKRLDEEEQKLKTLLDNPVLPPEEPKEEKKEEVEENAKKEEKNIQKKEKDQKEELKKKIEELQEQIKKLTGE